MNVGYRVTLTDDQRDRTRNPSERRQTRRAQAETGADPSAADAGAGDAAIAISIAVGEFQRWTRTKRRFVEGNLDLALSEEPRPGMAPRKLSGKQEALLVATACSNPPEGRARWTLELLAGEMVKLHRAHGTVARNGAPALGRQSS